MHSTGKLAKKYINETKNFLYDLFKINKNQFSLVFHSGATEGINSFLKGIAFFNFKNKKKCTFFFSTVDHSAVVNLEEDLKTFGHEVYFFSVNENGEFDADDLILKINKVKGNGSIVILNYTYINNESGVVWPLSIASKIKLATDAIIHVDAVQLVAKIPHWEILDNALDAYTFSGHKFGALKSVGFTFIKKSIDLSPWLVGGEQQDKLRAGTENALGIYSLKLALQDIVESFSPDILIKFKEEFELFLKGKVIIVGEKALERNLNTILAIFKGHKNNDLSIAFDMQGIEVSTGSACSAGIVKENKILLHMGFNTDQAQSVIRFSLSPTMNQTEAEQIIFALKKALPPFLT